MGLRAKTSTAAVNSNSGSKHNASANNCKFLNGGKKLNNRSNTTTKQTAVVTPATTGSLLNKVVLPCLNCKTALAETTCCSITSIRTTYRSSSTSALLNTAATASSSSSSSPFMSSNSMRPQTLNVHNYHETPADHTQLFLGEVLAAWRAKARCNVVPAERTQELFQELSFHPNDKQISDMLQTAKMLARKGSRQSNGLTFGEFCVLAADLKRFRTSSFGSTSPGYCDKPNLLGSLHTDDNGVADNTDSDNTASANTKTTATTTTKHDTSTHTNTNCSFPGNELRSTKSLSNVEDCKRIGKQRKTSENTSAPVEVFLGGSCNPTTWRADVAIPALKELGISFYNPQVSDWTPDLIELEHRAKEKARVLFFVMDSETRASAGAIEAAHIAGQNCKQLVLVLHPYKPNQSILNERISQQEYIDLTRNQQILRELVTRRGLPVLSNIPSGLQRTKEILAGFRDPPSNIASILVVIRGAFDRVNPIYDLITVEQCQQALLYLGYAQSLVNMDNLNKIIAAQREALGALNNDNNSINNKHSTNSQKPKSNNTNSTTCAQQQQPQNPKINSSSQLDHLDFNLFCVISAYLSVLQQEIHESGCISPIKGTNVPPPPVYLSNLQGEDSFAISYFSKNISRTSSNTSVPSSEERALNLNDLLTRNRDSGTSSPQPIEPLRSRSQAQLGNAKPHVLLNVETIETTEVTTTQTLQPQTSAFTAHSPLNIDNSAHVAAATEEESDSNDSVFSSSSSINSINCCDPALAYNMPDFREVYLGGSCVLRTKWRQELAVPYLKSKGISYHLPSLHESINPSHLDLPDSKLQQQQEEDDVAGTSAATASWRVRRQPTATAANFMRTRRKCRTNSGTKTAEEVEEVTIAEESLSWTLSPVRTNLFNPSILDSSRVLLFVITNETRSLAPMTLAAHCIGLMYNVVLAVQMLPNDCVIGNEKLTPTAIKDYNRGRSYLIDLAKRQGVPVFNDIKAALECTVEKIQSYNSRRYE
ncbi:uncharacterized protein LOC111676490 isoform X2 [Lucilia cuprina]|nr:uncharacterized protein LOC111676490 isoform X2 [Lucilia cuprina]